MGARLETPQANFRAGRGRGQTLRMKMSRKGYGGLDGRGPYHLVGQIRFHSTGNAVPRKEGGGY